MPLLSREAYEERLRQVRLLVLDVDGVLTGGEIMFIDADREVPHHLLHELRGLLGLDHPLLVLALPLRDHVGGEAARVRPCVRGAFCSTVFPLASRLPSTDSPSPTPPERETLGSPLAVSGVSPFVPV